MKVSNVKFKASAMYCVAEFMRFVESYGYYKKAYARYERVLGGDSTFLDVEYADSKAAAEENMRKAAKSAISKLLTLDKAFHKVTGEHICVFLETYEEGIEALEEIESFAN